MRKILAIAVHPDDETLGCGGTLLKHAANGDEIHWLIATCMTKDAGFSGADIARRKTEIKKAEKFYGFAGVHQLGFPATLADTLPVADIVSSVAAVMKRVRPDTLYLPFVGDAHSDHRVVFEAAYSCTKTFRYPFLRKILMMETVSETEFSPPVQGRAFVPNYFVDISAFMAGKLEAMSIFGTETAPHPFPRSGENIRALATFRGAASNCRCAEAFMLLKEIA